MDAHLESLIHQVDDLTRQLAELSIPAPQSGAQEVSRQLFLLDNSNGDNAWLLISMAFVLFMSMPGIAIYYAGMLSAKNVLGVVMQVFSVCCVVTVLWLFFGYSLAFAPSQAIVLDVPVDYVQFEPYNATNAFTVTGKVQAHTNIFGNMQRVFLQGMRIDVSHMLAPTVSESTFCAFELSIAILAASIISGSYAERMKYWSMMIFISAWHLLVYCPIAHTMWHPFGLLKGFGVLDFAGGNVVHISAGISGLVAAFLIGNRKGWKPRDYYSHPPHNILLSLMGMSLMWCGWLCFTAGNAKTSGFTAGTALMGTQIAACSGALTWLFTESIIRKKPSVLGMCNGTIAGLVAITPAAGYVDMNGAFFIGLFGGIFCYFGTFIKHYLFKIDDSLDTFGIHFVGGVIGGISVGFFATTEITGSTDLNGVYYANSWIGWNLVAKQVVGIVFATGWAGIMTFIILKVIDRFIGLRVSEADEDAGLDASLHEETIVNPEGKKGLVH